MKAGMNLSLPDAIAKNIFRLSQQLHDSQDYNSSRSQSLYGRHSIFSSSSLHS